MPYPKCDCAECVPVVECRGERISSWNGIHHAHGRDSVLEYAVERMTELGAEVTWLE